MAPTIMLITGANRGIGEGFLRKYLAQPNTIVIAANRNPEHPTSQALADLPAGEGSRLIVVKIDALDEQDPFAAAETLQKSHGIHHIDLVIANAGIALTFPKVADLQLSDLQLHMATNAYGVVKLYQAMRPLLEKSVKKPAFVTMGSKAGCMEGQPPVPNAAYGSSKAAVHWVTMKINAEDSWLNAFVLAPGLTETELGLGGIRTLGLTEFPMTSVDECCDSMIRIISTASKGKHGGKLFLWSGEESQW